MVSETDKVIGLALSNPKFRKQLLDPKVNNRTLLKKYGIKPTAQLMHLNKAELTKLIDRKIGVVSWCVGNLCGLGT